MIMDKKFSLENGADKVYIIDRKDDGRIVKENDCL